MLTPFNSAISLYTQCLWVNRSRRLYIHVERINSIHKLFACIFQQLFHTNIRSISMAIGHFSQTLYSPIYLPSHLFDEHSKINHTIQMLRTSCHKKVRTFYYLLDHKHNSMVILLLIYTHFSSLIQTNISIVIRYALFEKKNKIKWK